MIQVGFLSKMIKTISEIISIIIPVYNRESCITFAIKSILNQSFTDFKLYIVDDCSTDQTWDILKHFADSDERISVYRLPYNSGPSVARNFALDLIQGEWVSFIDSDDYIAEDFYEQLMKKTNNDVDLVISSFNSVSLKREVIQQYIASSYYEADTYNEALDIAYARNDDLDFVYNLCCNKLYRRVLFDGVRFPIGRLQEDAFIMPYILFNCKNRIVCAPEAFYYYVSNHNSISYSSQKGLDDLKRRCDLLHMYLKHIELYKNHGNALFHRSRLNYLNNVIALFRIHYKEYHLEHLILFKEIKSSFNIVLRDSYTEENPFISKKMFTCFCLFAFSPKLYLFLFP